jgi:protein-disulfide isomerase
LLKKINLSLFGKKLKITKIDIAKNNELIQKNNILSVPTIIIGDRKLKSYSIDEEEIVDAIFNYFFSSVKIKEEK